MERKAKPAGKAGPDKLEKEKYAKPRLTRYGDVAKLTTWTNCSFGTKSGCGTDSSHKKT
jgi:hypothetical protein